MAFLFRRGKSASQQRRPATSAADFMETFESSGNKRGAPDDKDEPTYPCRNCGRQFVKSSLEKHEPVCKKLTKLHRKPFDSGKQRATGSDITISDVRRAQKEKEKMGGQFPRPKTNWKERHENFIEAVSSSKKVDYALKTGGPLPPPPKTSVPSDYVQCPHCGRNFSQTAAERHMPFCKEQNAKKNIKPMTTSKSPMTSGGNRGFGGRPPQTGARDGSQTRAGRSDSRGATQDRNRSLTRGTTRSAVQEREQPPPATAAKRSNSAPRNPSRLKTPARDKAPSHLPPKTPKTRDGSRGRTGAVPTRDRERRASRW